MTLSTERRVLTTYDIPAFWTYEDCLRHRTHASRKEARAWAKHHERAVANGQYCRRCATGWAPQAFRCYTGGDHFHWGHSPKREEL